MAFAAPTFVYNVTAQPLVGENRCLGIVFHLNAKVSDAIVRLAVVALYARVTYLPLGRSVFFRLCQDRGNESKRAVNSFDVRIISGPV